MLNLLFERLFWLHFYSSVLLLPSVDPLWGSNGRMESGKSSPDSIVLLEVSLAVHHHFFSTGFQLHLTGQIAGNHMNRFDW